MMKKIASISVACLLLGLCGLTVFAVEQKRMSVQVRKGTVRSTPSFLGRIIASLNYGDQVVVKEEMNSWSKVDVPGIHTEAWMHSSALSDKKIVLKPGASDVEQAASSDELTLAGRGFNQEVEEEFKSKNPRMDFTWIDRMEMMVVSQNEIQAFVKDGDLNPEGGLQ
jgi:hypothetical protein